MGDPSSTPPGDVHRMSVGRARKGRATFVYRDPTVLGSRDTVLRGRGTTRPVISAAHNGENGAGERKVTRAPGRLVRDGRTQEKSWYTPPMSGTRLLLGSGNPGLSRAWRQPDGRAAAPNLDRDDNPTPCGSTIEIGMHSVVRRPSYPVLPNPTPTHPSAERNSTTFMLYFATQITIDRALTLQK